MLTENHRLLLQAALGDGAQAASAYKTWRSRVPLDDIGPSAYRVLGHVVDTAIRNRVEDPEMPRIRGVLKHTWINNMLRMRALKKALRSLQDAAIEVMVLKGAALFARCPALCTQLAVGDFDILVRAADGPRAIDALMKSGFRRSGEVMPECFVAADFEKQHALSFEHDTVGGNVDVHWWPLPGWTSQAYVKELFERSEFAPLENQPIRIPDLSDHLFLTLARSRLWESDEVFARTMETVQILRACKGNIDWKRLTALARRFHWTTIAEGILRLAQSELNVVIPDAVMDELGQRHSLLDKFDLTIGRQPFAERSPMVHFCQRVIGLVRSDPKVSPSLLGTAGALIVSPEFFHAIRCAAFEELPRFPGRSARSLWRTFVTGNRKLVTSDVDYVVGFSRPEETGRWTEGYGAVMTVPIEADLGTHVQINIVVTPLLTPSRTSFVTEVCSGHSLLLRKVFTTADPFPSQLTIEAEVVKIADFRGVVLAFDLPDAVRQTSLGLSDDARLLGLHVQGIEIVPPALPPRGISAHFLGRSARNLWRTFVTGNRKLVTSDVDYVVGFSRPEETGRWTEGYGAVMTVPIKADVGTHVQINIVVTPLLIPNQTSFVTEVCSGHSLLLRKVFTTADPFPARLTFEAEVVKIGNFRGAVLAFALPDAARPTSLGLSEDARLLGLHVEGIEVLPPSLPRKISAH